MAGGQKELRKHDWAYVSSISADRLNTERHSKRMGVGWSGSKSVTDKNKKG